MQSPDTDLPKPFDDENTAYHIGSPALERVLGWFLLGGVCVLAVLSFSPKAVTRFYTWPWILYWHVLLALPPLVFVLGAAMRRPAPRLGAALDVGLFLWAAVALGGAWFSPYRWQSMNAALLPLASVCLAYVVRGWLGFHPVASRERARHAFVLLGALGAVFVVVSWGYWIAFDIVPALESGATWGEACRIRNGQPLGHSIYTAGMVVLLLPVLATLAFTHRGVERVLWAVATIAALALVPVTSSRGGVLGVVALVAGAGALALMIGRLRFRAKLLLIGAGFAAAVVLVAFNPRLRELVVHREWSAASTESNRQRAAMLAAGLAMGVDRPWAGWGPGTVSFAYPRYRARLDGGVENVLQLHSAPVQIWAEHGAIGVLALLTIIAGIAMRAWRLRPKGTAAHAGTREDRARAWSLVLALAGYGVFALTDHQLDVPLFAGVIVAMLAVLSALTRPTHLARITWSPTFLRVVPAVAVAAAVALVGWSSRPNLRARQAFVTGVVALEHGDDDGFVAGVRRARELAPWEPFYPNQLATYLMDAMDRTSDEGRAATLRALAIGALRQSLAIRPEQEFCATNLGWLSLDGEQPAAATEYFRAAARLVPDKGGVYFGLGLALLQQGREAEAVRAFAVEWINDPRAVAHPLWTRSDWSARRSSVLATAQTLLAELSSRDARTRVAKPAAYLHALFAWWAAPSPAAATRVLVTAMTDEQREFFGAVRTSGSPSANTNSTSGQLLWRAWRAPEPSAELATLPRGWTPWRESLARRIAAHRESFAEFLTGPGVDADGLVRRYRFERLAFGMLMRNSDGLRVTDRTVREDNVLVVLLRGSIFPPKGWVPGPVMVHWLEGLSG